MTAATVGMMDPSHILQSYDLVAEPYARKFAGELQHKPLDRLFLDGVAAKLRGKGRWSSWAADRDT
jgi:hypothetical protein